MVDSCWEKCDTFSNTSLHQLLMMTSCYLVYLELAAAGKSIKEDFLCTFALYLQFSLHNMIHSIIILLYNMNTMGLIKIWNMRIWFHF